MLNLHPWDFDKYTFDEYMSKRKGFYNHEEYVFKMHNLQLRVTARSIMLPHLDKRDQKRPLDELVPDLYGKAEKPKDRKEWFKKMQERTRQIKLDKNARL